MYTDRLEYQGPRRGSRNEDSGKEPRIETGKEESDHGLVASLFKARDLLALDNLLLRKQTRMKEKEQACAGSRGADTAERELGWSLTLQLLAYKPESLF